MKIVVRIKKLLNILKIEESGFSKSLSIGGFSIAFGNKPVSCEKFEQEINNLYRITDELRNENKLLHVLLERSVDISQVPKAKGNLRKVQLIKTKLLELVSYVLTKNNIKYWLDYGTLIGAVRHGGFIPWDDDIDVSLLKEDILKLEYLLSPLLNLNSNFRFSKCEGLSALPRLYYKDFCVDFFSFEYVDKDYNEKERESFIEKWYKIHNELFDNHPLLYKNNMTYLELNKIVDSVKKYFLGNTYYSDSLSKQLIVSPENIFVCNKCNILSEDNIFPLKILEFENNKYPIPNNPIEHLFEHGIYGYKGAVMNFPKILDSGFHHTQSNYENNLTDYDTIYDELSKLVEDFKGE